MCDYVFALGGAAREGRTGRSAAKEGDDDDDDEGPAEKAPRRIMGRHRGWRRAPWRDDQDRHRGGQGVGCHDRPRDLVGWAYGVDLLDTVLVLILVLILVLALAGSGDVDGVLLWLGRGVRAGGRLRVVLIRSLTFDFRAPHIAAPQPQAPASPAGRR